MKHSLTILFPEIQPILQKIITIDLLRFSELMKNYLRVVNSVLRKLLTHMKHRNPDTPPISKALRNITDF